MFQGDIVLGNPVCMRARTRQKTTQRWCSNVMKIIIQSKELAFV